MRHLGILAGLLAACTMAPSTAFVIRAGEQQPAFTSSAAQRISVSRRPWQSAGTMSRKRAIRYARVRGHRL